MSDYNTWKTTSLEHLKTANSNFENGEYLTAYEKALLSSETILKAVLFKFNLFDWSNDKIHDQHKIFDKIRNKSLLSDTTINFIETIINKTDRTNSNLNYINLNSDNMNHADCFTQEVPKIRYPIGNSSPSQMVKQEDAEIKIKQARKLIEIIITELG